jgi:hypothetical protein
MGVTGTLRLPGDEQAEPLDGFAATCPRCYSDLHVLVASKKAITRSAYEFELSKPKVQLVEVSPGRFREVPSEP